jgi:hypothetical protein
MHRTSAPTPSGSRVAPAIRRSPCASRARDLAGRDFKRDLKERGWKPSSGNLALAAVDHFNRFLGLGPANVRREELKRAAPRALSEDEQRAGRARQRITNLVATIPPAGLRLRRTAVSRGESQPCPPQRGIRVINSAPYCVSRVYPAPGMRSLVAAVFAVAAVVATPSVASATTIFIESPSHNLACHIDSRYGALCTVFSDRRQAEVTQRGRVRVFPKESDPPSEGVPTLSYGDSVTVRKVRCTSRRRGMRCVHRPSGHGFLVARERIRRF